MEVLFAIPFLFIKIFSNPTTTTNLITSKEKNEVVGGQSKATLFYDYRLHVLHDATNNSGRPK